MSGAAILCPICNAEMPDRTYLHVCNHCGETCGCEDCDRGPCYRFCAPCVEKIEAAIRREQMECLIGDFDFS